MKHQYKPLLLLCLVFLAVGIMFCMNDILLPSLVQHFKMSYFQATMIQFSFYITYVIFPLPIAWMIHHYGYKTSLLVALLFCTLGCTIFIPAKIFDSYLIVLTAIFILSTGITVFNVAANPFLALLGDPEGSAIRMNFAQTFARIGYATTPIIATALIYSTTGEIRFQVPYALLAVVIIVIGVLILFSKMPSMIAAEEDIFSVKGIFREVHRYPHLFFGVFAMFFYVGAEACTAGFFIPYLQKHLGFTPAEASRYMTLYYIFAGAMCLMAVAILRYIKAHILVGIYGIGMIICYLIVIFIDTGYNEFFLAGLGLFLGIMFPTLFSLGIEDVGAFSGRASALLNFAIVGGAIFPPIQGAITDRFGVNVSYLVPCFCFVMITIYAFFFTKSPLMKRNFILKPIFKSSESK
jgi:MFS transporter, FHS family, L-fucose permease